MKQRSRQPSEFPTPVRARDRPSNCLQQMRNALQAERPQVPISTENDMGHGMEHGRGHGCLGLRCFLASCGVCMAVKKHTNPFKPFPFSNVSTSSALFNDHEAACNQIRPPTAGQLGMNLLVGGPYDIWVSVHAGSIPIMGSNPEYQRVCHIPVQPILVQLCKEQKPSKRLCIPPKC